MLKIAEKINVGVKRLKWNTCNRLPFCDSQRKMTFLLLNEENFEFPINGSSFTDSKELNFFPC